MPPKPKCTKEDIINAVFEITRESGLESVTVKEIGKRLGTSATPIFTLFKNMGDVRNEVCKFALKELGNYVRDALSHTPVFKQFGIKMVEFAKNQPEFFKILYMQEWEEGYSFEEVIIELGKPADTCIRVIMKDYQFSENEAKTLFKRVWIYVFSICALLANNVCTLSIDEFSRILSLEFQDTVSMIKSGNC